MQSSYHSGELAVQERAGVREMARRVSRIIRSTMPPVAQEFLSEQPMAVLGTVGRNGRVWASLLTGSPGFMQAVDEQTVQIDAAPIPGDPLMENLQLGQEVGLLAIDFKNRQRMKVNGQAEGRLEGGFYLHTGRVYSLCQKYIQAREVVAGTPATTAGEPDIRRSDALTVEQRHWIEQADTFFIASFHPESGANVSHRGGQPGFIRILNAQGLAFPDYSGNNMFNTLGNISENPNVGLLFLDFEGDSTLQITGQAQVIWDADRAAEFAGAQRLVEFEVEQVIEIAGANIPRWRLIDYSPFNPVSTNTSSKANH